MIKIYNDNCFNILKNMSDNSVDVTFTSPPYNRKRNDKYALFNDINADYYGFLCEVIDECMRVSRRHTFLNIMTNYYNSSDIYKVIGKYAEKIIKVFVWEKSNPLPASGNNITNAFEYIIVFGNEPLKSNTTYTKNIIKTSAYSKMPKNHKAVMHPDVADFFIQHFTNEGDIVLDPFLGIGTTGVSCKKYNRSFIGCEIVKDYFDEASRMLNVEVKANEKSLHSKAV